MFQKISNENVVACIYYKMDDSFKYKWIIKKSSLFLAQIKKLETVIDTIKYPTKKDS